LVLECTLIKQYKPRFNIRLRDDKNYLYIKLPLNEDFPRVYLVRRTGGDGAKYYGPYTNAIALRSTLKTVRRVVPYRTCTDHEPAAEDARPGTVGPGPVRSGTVQWPRQRHGLHRARGEALRFGKFRARRTEPGAGSRRRPQRVCQPVLRQRHPHPSRGLRAGPAAGHRGDRAVAVRTAGQPGEPAGAPARQTARAAGPGGGKC